MSKPKYIEETISIPYREISLNAVLARPETAQYDCVLMVMSPHPLMGGTMENNVVKHITQRAAADGCLTIRFNYQTGLRSDTQTVPGLEYQGEIRLVDLAPQGACVFEHLCSLAPNATRRVVSGYSLGAGVAGLVAGLIDCTHVIGFSPAVTRFGLDSYAECTQPKLFVAGNNDFVFDPALFQEKFSALPEPKEFTLLEGCDHFLMGEEERVYQAAAPFLLGR